MESLRVGSFAVRIGVAFAVTSSVALGGVTRVDVEERGVVLDGREFGDVGAYEFLRGTIHFAWDPTDAANARIVDLDEAPRSATGLVEASANFFLLQPEDPVRGRGTALVEVSNRGGKASLSYFNRARGSRSPREESHFGDGFLMRRGLTVLWVGWQFDVPPGRDVLRLRVPHLPGSAQAGGRVRADWVVDRATRRLAAGHRDHHAYLPEHPGSDQHVLTVRDSREGRDASSRARSGGSSAATTDEGSGGRGSPRAGRDPGEPQGPVATDVFVECDGSFEVGKIYELVYGASQPAVVGLGLAASRDVAAYAKRGGDCPFPVERALAVGISQTGRFLRHFLYQGFNRAEDDEKRTTAS